MNYEFKCTECNDEIEVEMKMSDYHIPDCDECNVPVIRHHRTPPNLDTYYPGSYKDNNPVHGI